MLTGWPKWPAAVATGTLTFRSIHEWDICAGVLMVRSGRRGLCLDGDGKPMTFNQEHPKASRRGGSERQFLLPVYKGCGAEAMRGKK